MLGYRTVISTAVRADICLQIGSRSVRVASTVRVAWREVVKVCTGSSEPHCWRVRRAVRHSSMFFLRASVGETYVRTTVWTHSSKWAESDPRPGVGSFVQATHRAYTGQALATRWSCPEAVTSSLTYDRVCRIPYHPLSLMPVRCSRMYREIHYCVQAWNE